MIVNDILDSYIDVPITYRKDQDSVTVTIRDIKEYKDIYSGPVNDILYIHPNLKNTVVKLLTYDSKTRTIRIFI